MGEFHKNKKIEKLFFFYNNLFNEGQIVYKKNVAITLRPKTVADICKLNKHCFALCIYLVLSTKGQSIEALYDTIVLITRAHEDAVRTHHENYFKNGCTPSLGLISGRHQITDTLIQLDEFSNSLDGVPMGEGRIFVINYEMNGEELAHSISIIKEASSQYLCFDPGKSPYSMRYSTLDEIRMGHINRFTENGCVIQGVKRLTFFKLGEFQQKKRRLC